jgi:hypothetical protein
MILRRRPPSLTPRFLCLSQCRLGARRDHSGLELGDGHHLLKQENDLFAPSICGRFGEPDVNAGLKQTR